MISSTHFLFLLATTTLFALGGAACSTEPEKNNNSSGAMRVVVTSEPASGIEESSWDSIYLVDFKATFDREMFRIVRSIQTDESNRVKLEDVNRSSQIRYFYLKPKLIFYNYKLGSILQISTVVGIVDKSIYRVVCQDDDVSRSTVLYGECDQKIKDTFGVSLNATSGAG